MLSNEEIEKAREILITIRDCEVDDSYIDYKIDSVISLINKLENEIKTLTVAENYYKTRYLEFNNAFIEGGNKLTEDDQR